ncbi:MAG: ABC transporter permease, partial [Vicinamibacterales bacterium]
VAPQLGRPFSQRDDQPHAAPVVILGDELWRGRYGSNPQIIGRSVLLDDEMVQVVGVMPAGFKLPTDFTEEAASPSQAWRPLQIDESQLSRSHGLFAAALLAPGASATAASQELAAVAGQLTALGVYPKAMRFTAFAVPFEDEIRGPVRPALWLLAGGVACLLLIACANVSNLLLVRGDAQLKELTLRRALGATPGRLRRQLGVEGLVLLTAGTLLALPLAFGLLTVPQRFDIPALNALQTTRLDGPMTLMVIAAAALTTIVFSLVPLATRYGDTQAASVLRATSAATTAAPVRARLRKVLVFAQVAMAMLLLGAAGLMIRSLNGLRHVELGFEADHLLTARVALPASRYTTPAQVVDFYDHLVSEAGTLPGVTAAGIVRLLPLATTIGDWGLDIEGFDEGPNQNAKGDWQVVSPGSFTAMGTRLVRGRGFTAADRTDSEPVAVVNETLARTYWRAPGDAVGGRIRLGSNPSRPWVRVVGVVADERHNSVTGAVKEKFYIPHGQWHIVTGGNLVRDAYVVMRTSGDPRLLSQ